MKVEGVTERGVKGDGVGQKGGEEGITQRGNEGRGGDTDRG